MDDEEVAWTNAGEGDASSKLELTLSRTADDTITGLLLNATDQDWKIDPRPQLLFRFEPAELLKFDMPSVPAPKETHGSELVVPAKSSVEIVNVTFKGSRWVFRWASDSGEKTHQCSYTLHPKGTTITVRAEHLGLGHHLEASITV